MDAATPGSPAPDLAERLAAARREVRQIAELPDGLVPKTAEDGYEIATGVAARLGWETLGWKIAGTTAAVREKLRINEPIYGRTYRQFAESSPAVLTHGDLLDPLVECEFFVTLSDDMPPRPDPWTMDDVRAAIGAVHAGIEVAECRFPNTALPPLPAILADGAASGRYIHGGSLASWENGLADVEVTLEVDGRERRSGRGRDVMGDPIAPLHWLAERLRRLGTGLEAGEMISTGSCTGMMPVKRGETIVARYGDAAQVEIRFE
ncbi:MAG: fumarylacetoacetate hydrolase family protein [Pseudomonadota bacterium]